MAFPAHKFNPIETALSSSVQHAIDAYAPGQGWCFQVWKPPDQLDYQIQFWQEQKISPLWDGDEQVGSMPMPPKIIAGVCLSWVEIMQTKDPWVLCDLVEMHVYKILKMAGATIQAPAPTTTPKWTPQHVERARLQPKPAKIPWEG